MNLDLYLIQLRKSRHTQFSTCKIFDKATHRLRKSLDCDSLEYHKKQEKCIFRNFLKTLVASFNIYCIVVSNRNQKRLTI